GDGLDAELPAGSVDAQRDLAAVRDQNFLEQRAASALCHGSYAGVRGAPERARSAALREPGVAKRTKFARIIVIVRSLFDQEERLTELDRIAILDEDADHLAGDVRLDLVHHL